MNPLANLLLAETNTHDRRAAACLRRLIAAQREALRTAPAIEPADLLIAVPGRRLRRAPRWWTALEAGKTAPAPVAASALSAAQKPSGCTAC
jgi:hypothetical protein